MEPNKYPLGLKVATVVLAITLMTGFVLMRGRPSPVVPGTSLSELPLDSPETEATNQPVRADSVHLDVLPSSKSGIVFPAARETVKHKEPARIRIDTARSAADRKVWFSSSKSFSPIVPQELILIDSLPGRSTDSAR